MRRIFGGLIFLLLQAKVLFGSYTLDLLPDFGGYLLIFFGAGALVSGSRMLGKIRFFTLILAACTGALWLTDLAGLGLESAAVDLVRKVFEAVSAMVVVRFLIAAVAEFQQAERQRYAAALLRAFWYVLILGRVGGLLIGKIGGFGGLASLLWTGTALVFLILFGRTAWLFVRLHSRSAPPGPDGDAGPGEIPPGPDGES